MMSFDFDAVDAAPTSKQQQAQTIPNAENNAWMNNDLVVPVDGTWRFVRTGGVPDTDLKTYDYGNMFISSIYGTGVTSGELYVEFTVELAKPSARSPPTTYLSATGAVATPFSTFTVVGESQSFQVVPGSTTTLEVLTSGEYLVLTQVMGTVISTLNSPVLTATGSGVGKVWISPIVNNTQTNGMRANLYRVDAGDRLTFSSVASASTTTNWYITITECQYSIT